MLLFFNISILFKLKLHRYDTRNKTIFFLKKNESDLQKDVE